MAKKLIDCVSEYQNMVKKRAETDVVATFRRRCSYWCKICLSNVNDDIVRIAATASAASEALLANLFDVASSK